MYPSTKGFKRTSVPALFFLLLLGCTSHNNTGENTDDGNAVEPCEQVISDMDQDGNLHIPVTDAQNIYFRSELHIATQTLKARSDFTIDWSELSVDMQQQEIDPLEGIDRLQMVVWKLSEAELLVKLNNDDLAMADVEVPGMVLTNNERTSVNFLEMETVAAAPVDEETLLNYIDPEQYDPEQYSYTVMAGVGTNPELGFKMLHILRFDPDEEKTEVRITNESTKLDYEVDIASSETIPLPAGNPKIVVDWSYSLEKNALGNPFIPPKIWYVNVAHYPNMNVRDLEDNFLEIEYIATDFYTATITSGASVNLNTLVDEEGSSFSGINEEGSWLIALICGDCANPAPWFLSILQPCED